MKAKTFNQVKEVRKAKSFSDIIKYNPYHDRLGRFTSGSGFGVSSSLYTGDKDRQAVTFTANPKTKEGAKAITSHGGVVSAAHGMVDNKEIGYKETDVSNFTKTVVNSKSTIAEDTRWRVTAYSEGEFNEYHPNAKCIVTKRGSTIAIDKDNGDIVSVSRSSQDYVTGKQLLQEAVKNGGTKLDSYDGNDMFYKKCGFEPVSWCKWSDAFAPSDWISANGYTQEKWDAMVKDGTSKTANLKVTRREDIVFYKYTGKTSKESLRDFKKRVKGYDGPDGYDRAYADRDNSMK